MVDRFTQAMMKLATVAQDPSKLIDCSEVIPVPKTLNVQATFPAGKTIADVEQAVSVSLHV